MAWVKARTIPAGLTALTAALVAAIHLAGIVFVADVAFCRVDRDFGERAVDFPTHVDPSDEIEMRVKSSLTKIFVDRWWELWWMK